MPYANNKISVIVEDQLPGFVRDDHNNFVQFVKSYYEFLELVNPPIDMPLRFESPDELVYNLNNQYGAGPFVVGEVIEQRANDTDPTIVTASATVYAFETTRTTKTVVVTSIGGTTGKFIRNKEIVGATSGIKYWSEVDLEQAPTGALQASYDVSNLRDLDLMTDQYIEFIQREIASGFPTNFADEIDKRTALKNLRDFYQSKGTENSFKLLFRLVFNEDIELYLPSEDMLRASVGEYSKRITLRSGLITRDARDKNIPRSEADIVGREIVGEQSGATAIVEKAQRIVYAGAAFTEIDISDKVGTFESGELLRVSYADAITNEPVNIIVGSYGMVDSITITDGGSNYAVGDRLTVTDSTGVGVIAQVSQVNETTGAVTDIEILDPGYNFTTAPDVTLDAPHSGDAGSIRFATGPLDSLLDYKFEVTDTANSFFAESDNRGASSNTGAVGNDIYEVNGATVFKPHEVDANSFSNFVTIPGEKEGLQAWWKFDTYPIAQDNIKINTLDGTFGDGNDPVANTENQGYWGPRVGDSVFRVDPRTAAFGYGPLNPLATQEVPSQNALTSNSYLSAGLVGFKPLIIDSSGNGRHAWVQTANVLSTAAGFTGRANVFVRGAFTSNGIYQDETVATITTANSWVNGPDQTNQESLGGVVLRAHDDLRNANTQTWVLWYYPYGELGYFSGTYQNDSEWAEFDSEDASFNGNTAPNIISRDWESYWSIQANTTGTATSDYHDVLLTFQGATFDNGNPVSHSQVANTTGHYPGSDAGTLNSGGGSLRAQTWNMIAMSIDHTSGVGNVFFYNTYDGFHSSNGFSIPTTQDANTTSAGSWPTLNGTTEGRAVVLGAASASANGDSNGLEQNPATSAHGRFAEVRYYDQALDEQQITHLFKNPGGRFDKMLTGDWAIVNPDVSGNTATAVVYDDTEESYVVRVGCDDTSTGLQLIYNKDIEFDANAHYKMTVKVNNSAGNLSNVQFGLVGVSNNGADLIGYDGSNDWDKVQPIVQSGTLTDGWVEKTAVFGGNTSQSGWSDDGSGNDGTENYTWNAPAKLHGDSTLATSNTTTFRPVLRWDGWSSGESTDIEYIKIEAQRPAKLTATVAGEFAWAGSITGDAGKLSSSATNEWLPKHLSDNSFYQTYSYVIRSGLSINRYKDLVERLAHTSGKRLFGEVDWVSPVSIKPTASSFADSILQLFVDFYGGSESLLFGEDEAWDSRSLKGDVAIKSDFGLYDLPDLPFDLDLTHGEFDILHKYDPEYQPDIVVDFTGATVSGTQSQIVQLDEDINTLYGENANLIWRGGGVYASFEATENGVKVFRDPAWDNTDGTAIPYHSFYSTYDATNDLSSFSFNGADYPYVRILMRKLEGTNGYWSGNLFYGIDGNDLPTIYGNLYPFTNGSENTEEPHWTSDFQWVTWDMRRNATWNSGVVTDLRFDFERNTPVDPYLSTGRVDRINEGQAGEFSDGVFEIKRIEILSNSAYRYGSAGPAWIAWDQSPSDNPYAKTHYSTKNLPDPTFATSNTATRPTKDTLIWEVSGAYSRLVTSYEEEYDAIKAGGDLVYDFTSTPSDPPSYAGEEVTAFEWSSVPYLSPQTRWSGLNSTLTWETSDPDSDGYMVHKHDGVSSSGSERFAYIVTSQTPGSFGTNIIGKQVETVRMRIKRTSDTTPDDAVWTGTMFWALGYDGPDANEDGNVLPDDYPYMGGGIQSMTTSQPATWGSDWHDVDWDVSTEWEDVDNIGDIRFDFDRNIAEGSTSPNIYYIESITFIMKDQNVLALDGHYHGPEETVPGYGNDGLNWQTDQGLPLNIDSSKYRYVRMKVRRIGPGGYGEVTQFGNGRDDEDPLLELTEVDTSDWLGACQAETTDNMGANLYRASQGVGLGANTIPQPSTLIVPAGSDPDTKSPWHILEWDMHQVGAGGDITRDIFATKNIGWLGITLTGNPIEDIEKFEIDWIQVDDGTKYPRGNHQWPIARTDQVADLVGFRNQFSDGSGVGGHANTLYVNSSWDYSTRPMGQFSARVSTPGASEIKFAETGANNATVVYISMSSTKRWLINVPIMLPGELTHGESHVLRASANTANATDWILSTQLHANTDLASYNMMSDPSAQANFTPVTLELTDNDTLFVGHLYHEDVPNSPGSQYFVDPADQRTDDPRPFMLFHYQPFANTETFGQYGTSNTYTSELVLFGNTSAISSGGASVEVSGHGFRTDVTAAPVYGLASKEHVNSIDTMINYRGHHFTVGRGSQNVLLTKPAPGKSRDGTDAEVLPLVLGEEPRVLDVPYADGLSVVRTGPDRSSTIGVESFEIANTLTLDTSGTALGDWRPHAIIEGPKGSFFVACNNYTLGSDTVYCYHIVPTQNVSTGEMTALTVAPVYANTAHTSDLFQGCTGMAIDNLDPPNFYYATANTIHKIEPKGYSYEIGDTKMTELLDSSDTAWDALHGTGSDFPPLGGYSSIVTANPGLYGNPSTHKFMMEGTYCRMKVDRYNRLFLRGRANVYLYDTNTDELSVAYAPQENQTDIDTVNEINSSYDTLTIFDFDVEPETGELVFLIGDDTDGDMIAGSVRPNTSLSYTAGGGQLVQTIIQPALTPGRYFTAIPSGIGNLNRFASSCGAKIRIRKRKDDGQVD
jgi:hypothetical protein